MPNGITTPFVPYGGGSGSAFTGLSSQARAALERAKKRLEPQGMSGGGGGGGGFQPPFDLEELMKAIKPQQDLFEMPPWLSDMLRREAEVGGIQTGLTQTQAQRYLTPEAYLGRGGLSGWLRDFHRKYGYSPSEQDAWRIIATSPEYLQWREGILSQFATTRFAPYKELLESQYEEAAAGLGVAEEGFRGMLASRGIAGGGAAEQAFVRDVAAPVYRATTQATRQVFLDFLDRFQGQERFQETVRQEAIGRVTQATFTEAQIRNAQEAGNLDRTLQAYLGYGGMELGYERLGVQSRIANREFAFRAYENKLRWIMFQMGLQQREKESQREFWGGIFEEIGKTIPFLFL